MKEFRINAPKDAVERKSIYIMVDTLIEATPRQDGSFSQELYLDDGRLEGKLEMIGGIEDEALRRELCDCKRNEKLLLGLGVSIAPVEGQYLPEEMVVQWKHYGRQDRYGGGTTYRFTCPTDGSECLYFFDQLPRSADDDVIGNLTFFFGEAGQMAEVNVRLLVDDSVSVPVCQKEEKVDRDSEAYQKMIARSLVDAGRDGRLSEVIRRWKQGEEITVSYIGGSITQGAGAKPIATKCYAYRSFQALSQRFGAQAQYVKAGVGGTSSEFGLMRYRKEVCLDGERQPDLVVIEFAVNDSADETEGRCLESLVREALSGEKHPAVVLLFSVFANDWNLQERMIPVGLHYGIPMVSVRNAVVPQFALPADKGRVISKRQYFYDTYHPTNVGHTVMADCLVHLFDVVEQQPQETDPVCAARLEASLGYYGKMFGDIRLVTQGNALPEACSVEVGDFTVRDTELQCVERDADSGVTPEFPENWMKLPGTGSNNPFVLRICAKDLFLIFKDSGATNVGTAVVTVDGTVVYEANPHENNWTHCNVKILHEDEVAKMHMVEVSMKSGDEEKAFTILGIGYTR